VETYQNGDMIIREGDDDRDLFLLSYGMVSVSLQFQSKRGMRRLNAINPGVSFGEIAMLDHKPRSANILAEGDVKIFRLPYNNFIDLMEKEPAVANKLILNMALILSTRLRLSTEEIKALIDN
jgi:CRP-like cAMP-binding protein